MAGGREDTGNQGSERARWRRGGRLGLRYELLQMGGGGETRKTPCHVIPSLTQHQLLSCNGAPTTGFFPAITHKSTRNIVLLAYSRSRNIRVLLMHLSLYMLYWATSMVLVSPSPKTCHYSTSPGLVQREYGWPSWPECSKPLEEELTRYFVRPVQLSKGELVLVIFYQHTCTLRNKEE